MSARRLVIALSASMIGCSIIPYGGHPRSPEAAISRPAFTSLGSHESPTGECAITLEANPQGGDLTLALVGNDGFSDESIADDVSGAIWLTGNRLAYSVSPVYGKPGLFVVDCRSRASEIIASPRTFNSQYPAGADYFELVGASEDGRLLYFYYAPDVEQVDFRSFRQPSSLHVVDAK